MAKLVRICPKCDSRRMEPYDIYRYGGKRKRRYRCQRCGHLTIYPVMKMVAERRRN